MAQRLDRFDEIARQPQEAACRKQLRRFRFQPFDAGADRDERISRLTLRAFRRQRHREAAMEADQAAPEPMNDQPGVAIRTGEPKSALAAERERGVPAAIEETEGPRAAFERVRHRLREARCDEAPAWPGLGPA